MTIARFVRDLGCIDHAWEIAKSANDAYTVSHEIVRYIIGSRPEVSIYTYDFNNLEEAIQLVADSMNDVSLS